MTTPTDAPGADDATVLAAWHDAVNTGDIEAAVSLCSDDASRCRALAAWATATTSCGAG